MKREKPQRNDGLKIRKYFEGVPQLLKRKKKENNKNLSKF